MVSFVCLYVFNTCTYRQKRDSDPNLDAPSLDFEYSDSDLLVNEISELYSYSENSEFETTRSLFHSGLESVFGPETTDWNKLTETQKKNFVMVMLDKYEVILSTLVPPSE